MSATFQWVIEWMQTTPDSAGPSKAVLQVGWRVNGEQEDNGKTYTASVYSTCTLPPADPQNFIAFQDLTQDIVLGWCYANGVDKDSAEQAVQSNIDNQINPPTQILPPPWQS